MQLLDPDKTEDIKHSKQVKFHDYPSQTMPAFLKYL